MNDAIRVRFFALHTVYFSLIKSRKLQLTMLAFLIDQVQELTCTSFQQARKRFRSRTSLWERMRALFVGYFIDDWETFWQAIIRGHQVARLQPKAVEPDNTS